MNDTFYYLDYKNNKGERIIDVDYTSETEISYVKYFDIVRKASPEEDNKGAFEKRGRDKRANFD